MIRDNHQIHAALVAILLNKYNIQQSLLERFNLIAI